LKFGQTKTAANTAKEKQMKNFTLVLINEDGSYSNDVSRKTASVELGKSQYALDKLIGSVKDGSFKFNFDCTRKQLMVISYNKEDIDIQPAQAVNL